MTDVGFFFTISLIAVLVGVTLTVLPVPEAIAAVAGVIAVVFLVWGYRKMYPDGPFWVKGLLIVVFGQALLNYGFSNITLPAGPLPIPLSETLLMVTLFYGARRVFAKDSTVKIPPLMLVIPIWVLWNLAWHLPSGFARSGVEAARDALPSVELLFIVGGFLVVNYMLAQGEKGERQLVRFGLAIVLVSTFYYFLYPAADVIGTISPRVPGPNRSVPLFGNFGVISVPYLCVFLVPLWLWQHNGPVRPIHTFMLASCMLSSLLAYGISQARIAYILFVVGWVVLLCTGARKTAAKFVTIVLSVALLGLGAIDVLDIEIQGRISTVSLSGIIKHVASLDGDSGGAEFAGAANGIAQRRAWREKALSLWSENASTVLLGSGFGVALTDLVTYGSAGEIIVVREPHNSFVSTLSRSGLLGLSLMLFIHASMLWFCVTGYYKAKDRNRTLAAVYVAALLWEIYSLLNAWGQPYFENPFAAIPTYFFIGLVYALRNHYVWDSEEEESDEPASARQAANKPALGPKPQTPRLA